MPMMQMLVNFWERLMLHRPYANDIETTYAFLAAATAMLLQNEREALHAVCIVEGEVARRLVPFG